MDNSTRRIFTVSEVNSYVKTILNNDALLNDILISGEITGYKKHFSGHMYFSLKEDDFSISAVMFKGNAQYINFDVTNGVEVEALCSVTLYEKTGSFQVVIKSMRQKGVGDLQIKIDNLKQKLSKQGYFDISNKKQLPTYPKHICVVTSRTGSVIQDILNITNRRNKNIKVSIAHTSVQGVNAPIEIAEAINLANTYDDIDIIIVARGGGSFLELMPFNEEVVANAIYKSKIPIVSAVGHETDFTVSDLCADVRASTPSEAGEICFPTTVELKQELAYLSDKILKDVSAIYNHNLQQYEHIKNYEFFQNPIYIKEKKHNELTALANKIDVIITNRIDENCKQLEFASRIINNLNPVNNILKGYSISTDKSNELIKSISNIKVDDTVKTKISDGYFLSTVTKIVEQKEE